MNDWFKEYWNNYTGRNRFYTSSVYNPSTGEINVYALLGLCSAIGAVSNFFLYVERREAFVSVMLSIFVIGLGIAGLILSIKNVPYALGYKSIYRVMTTFSGILFSLAGILVTVGLYIYIFVPQEVIVSCFKNLNFD